MNKLSYLKNHELEANLKDLVSKERKLLHVILEHIKEIDSRKIYLERAYSSLYEYLIQECGYSGSAAMRRIEAARLLRDVPEMAEQIRSGSMNLSQIGELSRAIKETEKMTGEKVSCLQKTELVVMISGKSTHETQKELAQVLNIPVKEFDKQRIQQDESVRLEITFSKEQFEKLQQCKDLAAHLLSQNNLDASSWASVLEVVADQFLNRKDPVLKTKDLTTQMGAAKASTSTTASVPERISNTLTPKVRSEVLARDLCCQFKDPVTGRQCRSTYARQVDHKKSKWAEGNNSKINLQILCAAHNRLKYQKENFVRNI